MLDSSSIAMRVQVNNPLLESLHQIRDELPKIYQKSISAISACEIKRILENEKSLFDAITLTISNFFEAFDAEQQNLYVFGKHVLSALEGIFGRLSQVQSDFLPTRLVHELSLPLRTSLEQPSQAANLAAVSLPTPDVLEREHAAFIMQSQLQQLNIHQKLNVLKAKAFANGFKQKKVFISYAWPIENDHQEAWTKEFVLNLANDLEATGLEVILDRKQSNAGSPLLEFMREHIRTADHVVVICDRTMQYKFEVDGSTGVVFEYIETMNRWRKKKPTRFVIPFCLTKDNTIPGLVQKFAAVSSYEDGYLGALKELITLTYGFGTTFDAWWKENIDGIINNHEIKDFVTPQKKISYTFGEVRMQSGYRTEPEAGLTTSSISSNQHSAVIDMPAQSSSASSLLRNFGLYQDEPSPVVMRNVNQSSDARVVAIGRGAVMENVTTSGSAVVLSMPIETQPELLAALGNLPFLSPGK